MGLQLPARAPLPAAVADVALPGPPAAVASVVVVVVLSNSSRTPEVQRLAHELAAAAHVVALDPRGHGRSKGRSTLGRCALGPARWCGGGDPVGPHLVNPLF